jgi:hypothetical protein
MSDRKPASIALPAALVLALLGVYVGAYFAAVKPAFVPYGNGIGCMYWVGKKTVGGGTADDYRSSRRLDTFFAPIHWLDRRIRRDMWRS